MIELATLIIAASSLIISIACLRTTRKEQRKQTIFWLIATAWNAIFMFGYFIENFTMQGSV